MSEKQTDLIENNVKESGSPEQASSIAHEIANQLSDFSAGKASDSIGKKVQFNDSFFTLSEKERKEAVNNAGNSLDAMVKGDIPKLRERLKELGVSTAELEKVEKKLTEKVEQAKPLQDAILKGDTAAMQKLLKTMDPKQLEEVAELVQKHFDKMGAGIEVDYTDGKLIISRTKGDRAVAISADSAKLIGVNQDGSYDFNRQFRHGNAGNELKSYGDGALFQFAHPFGIKTNIMPENIFLEKARR